MTDRKNDTNELETLRWQVANWERKEISRAVCCAENEEKASLALELLVRLEWVHNWCRICGGKQPFDDPRVNDETLGHREGCQLSEVIARLKR
jgi:hypothetical protein